MRCTQARALGRDELFEVLETESGPGAFLFPTFVNAVRCSGSKGWQLDLLLVAHFLGYAFSFLVLKRMRSLNI